MELEVRRRTGITLPAKGLGVREVARLIGTSPGSVTRWRQTYERAGKEGLKAKRHPGAKAFSAGPPVVGGNAFGRGTGARVLYGLTDFEAGGAGDRETFWTSLSPLLCMGDTSAAEMEFSRSRVKKAHRKRMTIAPIDERGFMLQGVRARTWAPRGHTPIQRVAGPRKHISMISAITVSPIKRRVGLYLETYHHSINREDVLPFMRSLRRSLGRGVIFVLDLLNAHRWAAREYRRRAASVEFGWLPPYAPDLTPVEQVRNHGKSVIEGGKK